MRTCPLNSNLFLSWLRSIWMVGEALDVGGGNSDRAASYQEPMSHEGHSLQGRPSGKSSHVRCDAESGSQFRTLAATLRAVAVASSRTGRPASG
jgi:hypothetical protein